MKNPIAIVLIAFPLYAIAADQQDSNKYNPHSYGAPQLYYSPEAKQEREEQELLRESNRIAQERLEIERERLEDDRRFNLRNSEDR